MKTSIITPVWNRADLTFNFLNQHLRPMVGGRPEIVIIDNGSTDTTTSVLAAFTKKLDLKYIRNDKNVGFGRANNQGAKLATGDILIFLNNDVIISGDYITPIGKHLEQTARSITGAELLAFDTGWNVFDGKVIPYITGWCLAMTRAAFEELGGFDERYIPGDYEDIDICYAATQAGYSLQPLQLPLYHLSGQTARQLPDRRAMTEKHRRLFVEKWGFNGHQPN
jgi:GT2 family glycosyltransferase